MGLKNEPVPEFLSAHERLKCAERQSLVVGALPADIVEAIETAEYGAIPDRASRIES